MKEYAIIRRDDSLDWAAVPELAIDAVLWNTEAGVRAWAQLCWDEEALYVRLRAREAEIRAEHPAEALLAMPCEDSCLEFFFSPAAGDARYFNIEFNPNGCMYLGFGGDRESRVRLLPKRNPFDPAVRRTQDGWEIAYRVPFAFVRQFYPDFQPKAGDALRANCYKCGDLTVREHYLSWNPCTSPTPDFHRPRDFGRMILSAETAGGHVARAE